MTGANDRLSVLETAREVPAELALIVPAEPGEGHHPRELSYEALAREVTRALTWLEHHALMRGGPVALVASTALDTVAMLLALLEARVPPLLLHPRAPEAERERVLAALPPAALCPADWARGTPPERRAPLTLPQAGGEAAAIFTTSGTTGSPKGVLISRAALLASAEAARARLGFGASGDRWLTGLPLAHVGGFSVLVRALVARRAAVVREASTPESFRAAVVEGLITHASLVPTVLARLLDARPAWDPPPTLRALMLGGAGTPAELRAEALRRGWPVRTTYGLTEAAGPVTLEPLDRPGVGSGSPLGDTEVRIREGRIELQGPTLMSAYLPLGAHPDPFTEDGWLRTGDLGELLPDGDLRVSGRVAELIVTGGENVLAGEVEAALCTLPGVTEAFVYGRPDRAWGECVTAAIVLAPGASAPALLAVRAGLRERLATFKLPRALSVLDGLPRLPTGKLDRRGARDRAEAAPMELLDGPS
jgi:O-succinylbenzoic acid--CoA ligase